MSAFSVPAEVEGVIDALVARYPAGKERAASLMVLHTLQEHFGHLSREAIEWAARRLRLEPIHVWELVTFYPMFREQPAGRYLLKVCRTLSCALGGAAGLHAHLCGKLGLDATRAGLQTTGDGKFSVEFVECLASCGTAPVMMCNEAFHEGVSLAKADEILGGCQ